MKTKITINVDNEMNTHFGAVSDSPQQSFDENQAVEAAQHCLLNTTCDDCDLCRYLCPDLCITKNETTRQIEIDLDYCKGCGICAYICPKNAISMIRESQVEKC